MLQFQFVHYFTNGHILDAPREVFGFVLFYSSEEFLNFWLVNLADNLIGVQIADLVLKRRLYAL